MMDRSIVATNLELNMKKTILIENDRRKLGMVDYR